MKTIDNESKVKSLGGGRGPEFVLQIGNIVEIELLILLVELVFR